MSREPATPPDEAGEPRPAPARAPDDQDVGWGDWRDQESEDDRERWYEEQRPPHHGG